MKGVVREVTRRGMVAIEVSGGDYTVAELLGDELEVGDEVSGALESLGGETLSGPGGRPVQVFIEDCQMTARRATAFLRRMG